jgi:nitroimidazol reductase NimA-like FMN-containing flavoprotein (pyridoxamine 5'-phosphate oxidase superfamily)
MLNPAQRDFVVSILDEAADLTIATLRADGWPQATTVSFANDGLAVYFGTNAESQKAQNIARDNRVSVTVNCPYDGDWSAIRGVSIGGRAQRVTASDEAARVGALMAKKFPQISQFVDVGAGFEMALFRIDAEIISVLDYSKGFGHVDLLTV